MRKLDKNDNVNYYKIIKKHLKKQYPDSSEKELACLCREVVFAPKAYTIEINNTPTDINTVRENLADYVEQKTAENSFIPYSLDAEIADLIESTNCETSSMNEYYRWINVTTEILQNSSKCHITDEDINVRDEFLNMSYARESEILLCLALYEAAGVENNKEKINMLRFKLARLREMRSIVRNTPGRTSHCNECDNKLQLYLAHCKELQQQKLNFSENINLNLKLNINHNEEDYEEDCSYLEHLRRIILYVMRKIEKISDQNHRSEMVAENTEGKRKSQPVTQNQNSIER